MVMSMLYSLFGYALSKDVDVPYGKGSSYRVWRQVYDLSNKSFLTRKFYLLSGYIF